MCEENWKAVVGYEGYYSVSSLGRVQRDAAGQGARAGVVLKTSVNRKGYVIVALHCNGRRHVVTVHRILMASFVGPRPAGMEVNHKNGVKADNRLENLEYVTASQNMKHAYRTGLMPRLMGGLSGMAILTEPAVRAIKASLSRGEGQSALARQHGVSPTAIRQIAIGRTWRHVA